MNRCSLVSLIFLLILSLLSSQKTSKEIQDEINTEKNKADKIRLEIKEITDEIQKKDIESKKTKDNLIRIEEQIRLAEKLLQLIKLDKDNISTSVLNLEIDINKKEQEIKKLKQQYSDMIIHLYKTESNGYLDILLSSDNWSDITYKIKYLEILSEEKESIEDKLNMIIIQLNQKIVKFAKNFSTKQNLLSEEKNEIAQLNLEKNKKKQHDENLDKEKFHLQKKRDNDKKKLLKINKLLKQLEVDEKAAKKREEKIRKKREEELRKIKEEKERKKKIKNQKFANNKGKLPWPADGTIIEPYGGIKACITIKTEKNAGVKSIFDGMIVEISNEDYMGTVVKVDHADGFYTIYSDLNVDGIPIQEGQIIEAETLIGNTSDEILEFYIYKYDADKNDGGTLNPEEWIK